jgi:hypothetical protein
MAVTIADKLWSGWSPFSGGAGSGRVSTHLLVGGQPDRNGYSPLMVTAPLTGYIDDAVHSLVVLPRFQLAHDSEVP